MATVSIIVPVYNCKPWLRECLDSIVAQSYTDWQLILVDDGSTDGSAAICDEFTQKDTRIVCIHQSNKGVSESRNVALDHSTSPFVMFVDADDILHREATAILTKHIQSTGLRIVAGKHLYSENCMFPAGQHSRVKKVSASKLIRDILYQKKATDNSVSWKIFDRKLFDDVRFRPTRFEDLDIFYRLYLEAGEIGVCDDVIYFYRKHPGSFINSWSEERKDILEVADNMEDYLCRRIDNLKGALNHRRFSANYNVYNALCSNRQENSELAMKCYAVLKQLAAKVAVDPRSRLKNRLGAFSVLLGNKFAKNISLWRSKY